MVNAWVVEFIILIVCPCVVYAEPGHRLPWFIDSAIWVWGLFRCLALTEMKGNFQRIRLLRDFHVRLVHQLLWGSPLYLSITPSVKFEYLQKFMLLQRLLDSCSLVYLFNANPLILATFSAWSVWIVSFSASMSTRKIWLPVKIVLAWSWVKEGMLTLHGS